MDVLKHLAAVRGGRSVAARCFARLSALGPTDPDGAQGLLLRKATRS